MPPCSALPQGVRLALDGFSVAGCLLPIGAYAALPSLRTFSAKLSACFSLAVLIGLPAWLLPAAEGSETLSGSDFEQFSYLSSMLWADAAMVNAFLVGSRGSRVAWRYEALYHALGWGVPALSLALRRLTRGALDPAQVQLALYDAPLALSLALMLGLFARLSASLGAGASSRRPKVLLAAAARKRCQLAAFLAVLIALNVPFAVLAWVVPRLPPPHNTTSARPAATLGSGARGDELGLDGGACADRGWASAADATSLLYGLAPLVLFLCQGPVRRALWQCVPDSRRYAYLKGGGAAAGGSFGAERWSDGGAEVDDGVGGALLAAGSPRSTDCTGDYGSLSLHARGTSECGLRAVNSTADFEGRLSAEFDTVDFDAEAPPPVPAPTVPLPLDTPPPAGLLPLSVFCATWNMGGCAPPADLSALFPRGGGEHDLVAIGVQESASRGWSGALLAHLGDGFTTVAHVRLLGLRLHVAIRCALAHLVRDVREGSHGTGLLNLWGNKGAVGISMWLGDARVAILNCHLAAHVQHLRRRNSDLKQLLAGLRLGVGGTSELQAEAHHVFLLGDLNYRLAADPSASGHPAGRGPRAAAEAFDAAVRRLISQARWSELVRSDQLTSAIARGEVLYGWSEGGLGGFPPTFKLVVGQRDVYKPSRCPSYCDRLLWHSAAGHEPRLVQSAYASPRVLTSDHAPVVGVWRLAVPAPPRDVATLSRDALPGLAASAAADGRSASPAAPRTPRAPPSSGSGSGRGTPTPMPAPIAPPTPGEWPALRLELVLRSVTLSRLSLTSPAPPTTSLTTFSDPGVVAPAVRPPRIEHGGRTAAAFLAASFPAASFPAPPRRLTQGSHSAPGRRRRAPRSSSRHAARASVMRRRPSPRAPPPCSPRR